jgi:hypothetical protein
MKVRQPTTTDLQIPSRDLRAKTPQLLFQTFKIVQAGGREPIRRKQVAIPQPDEMSQRLASPSMHRIMEAFTCRLQQVTNTFFIRRIPPKRGR